MSIGIEIEKNIRLAITLPFCQTLWLSTTSLRQCIIHCRNPSDLISLYRIDLVISSQPWKLGKQSARALLCLFWACSVNLIPMLATTSLVWSHRLWSCWCREKNVHGRLGGLEESALADCALDILGLLVLHRPTVSAKGIIPPTAQGRMRLRRKR